MPWMRMARSASEGERLETQISLLEALIKNPTGNQEKKYHRILTKPYENHTKPYEKKTKNHVKP